MIGLLMVAGIILMFIILGIVFLCGHGAILIAGYNTSPKEVKDTIDTKKLCRSMGFLSLFVAVIFSVLLIFLTRVETGAMAEEALLPYALVTVGLLLAAAIVEMLYANKCCKKQP